MHIPTHILSGWICGNFIPSFGPRERFFCMVAASAPDLDGLSLLGGWECYYDWHHVLMHNLPFAVILAALLACFSRPKLTAFAVYFGLVHLHFALDLLGSGSDCNAEKTSSEAERSIHEDFNQIYEVASAALPSAEQLTINRQGDNIVISTLDNDGNMQHYTINITETQDGSYQLLPLAQLNE